MDSTEINPASFIFTGMVVSVVTVVFVNHVFIVFALWSLLVGASLAFYLLKSFDEVPSLYILLQLAGIARSPKATRPYGEIEQKIDGCGICSKKGCNRHKPQGSDITKSFESLTLPETVDNALTELLEIILNTHVYSWYRDLSRDQGFVDQLRSALYQTSAVFYLRLQKVHLSKFLIEKILRKFLVHVDSFFFVKEQATNKDRLQ